ncbi:TRAP transporter small permease [Orrella marina]|nr:TRAP transporter small permease [Orrella marina]
MQGLIEQYCKFLRLVCVLLLAAMVVMVMGNVVLRYGFNSGLLVSEELSRWLFVWMTFLGAIIALAERAHLGTDVLLARIPKKARLVCLILAQILMIYASWLVLDGSLTQAELNWFVTAPVTGTPVWVFYASGVVFGISSLWILLYGLYQLLRGRLPEEEDANQSHL